MNPTDTNLDYKAYYKRHKSRAWVIPVVIGSATILILIFLIFAFIQKTEVDKARRSAEEMFILANKREHDAIADVKIMTQRIKDLEEQLKECSSK